MKTYRRKSKHDLFDPDKKKTYVCEFHFKDEDIKVTHGSSGRKFIRPGNVPSVFDFKNIDNKKRRESPTKRVFPTIEYSSESIIESDSNVEQDENNPVDLPDEEVSKFEVLKQELNELKLKLQNCEEHVLKLEEKNTLLQSQLYNYENISKDKELFRKTTGIELQSFKSLINYLNPGEKCSN